MVTATGGSPNTYTVTINRGLSNDNFLKSLSIPPGKLDFKVTSFVYNVTVLSNVDNVRSRQHRETLQRASPLMNPPQF